MENIGLELLNDLSKQPPDEIKLLVEREKLKKRYKVLRRKNKNTADRLARQYREYRASKIQETFLMEQIKHLNGRLNKPEILERRPMERAEQPMEESVGHPVEQVVDPPVEPARELRNPLNTFMV